MGKYINFRPQLYLILIFLSLKAFSQGLNTIEPIGNAASGSISSIGSFVNAATGAPTYSVPLMSISSGPLSQSVSISYGSNGELLTDMGGDVGLGWHLNYGGQITREIRGYPDDYHDGWISPGHSFDPTDWRDRHGAVSGEIDSEADLFSWNAGGYSGKFTFAYNANYIIQTPETDCKIYPTFDGQRAVYGAKFDGFEVVLPTGTSYFFGGILDEGGVRVQRSNLINLVNPDHGWNNSQDVTIPSNAYNFAPISWLLHKIKDLNGNEIEFSYKNQLYREDALNPYRIGYNQEVRFLNAPVSLLDIWHYGYAAANGVWRLCLESIAGSDEHIEVVYNDFSVYETSYPGLLGKRLLSRLTKNTGLGSSITLDYASFASRNRPSSNYLTNHDKWYKPRLTKIIPHGGVIVNVNNPGVPHYKFTYNAVNGLQYPLRGKTFIHEDWLGYSADNTNFYGITQRSFYHNGVTRSFGSGTRNPQHVWSRKVLLKEVSTPQGGKVSYTYEPNRKGIYLNEYTVQDILSCSSTYCSASTNTWKQFTYDPNSNQTIDFTPTSGNAYGSAQLQIKFNSNTYTQSYSLTANASSQNLSDFLNLVTGSANAGTYQFRVATISRSSNQGTASFNVKVRTPGGIYSDILVSGSRVKTLTIDDNNGNQSVDNFSYNLEGSSFSSGAIPASFDPVNQSNGWVSFGSAPQSALRFYNGANILYRDVRVSRNGGGSYFNRFNIPQRFFTNNSSIGPEDRGEEYDRHLGLILESRTYEGSSTTTPYSKVVYKYDDAYTASSLPHSTSWRAIVYPDESKDVIAYDQVKSIAPRLTQTISTVDGKTTTHTISYHWWAKSAAPFATYTSHWDGSVTQTHSDFSQTFAGQSDVRSQLRNRNAILLPTVSRTFRNGQQISETLIHYGAFAATGARQSSPTSNSLFVPWKTELKRKALNQSGTGTTGSTLSRILSETLKIDPKGRAVEVRSFDKPAVTFYTYANDLLQEVKYLNSKTNYEYVDRLLKKKISPNGDEVNYMYDNNNKINATYTNRLGARTEYHFYDADPSTGKLASIRIKSRATNASPWQYSFTTYDGLGREVQSLDLGTSISNPNGGVNGTSGSLLVSQTKYNNLGQVESSFPMVSIAAVNIYNGRSNGCAG